VTFAETTSPFCSEASCSNWLVSPFFVQNTARRAEPLPAAVISIVTGTMNSMPSGSNR
jgi:hypothetical protein